ncbi:DsbA family protein, partial [Vibrio parahaemolyticus]|nr:DsbA family protein [Vibrio parahaemolyticus]
KGFAVDSMVRRMDKQFENSGLTGVPAVIVNNKYLVQAQSIKTMDEYFSLVNYLLTLK